MAAVSAARMIESAMQTVKFVVEAGAETLLRIG
jgi:hypothetical protein